MNLILKRKSLASAGAPHLKHRCSDGDRRVKLVDHVSWDFFDKVKDYELSAKDNVRFAKNLIP